MAVGFFFFSNRIRSDLETWCFESLFVEWTLVQVALAAVLGVQGCGSKTFEWQGIKRKGAEVPGMLRVFQVKVENVSAFGTRKCQCKGEWVGPHTWAVRPALQEWWRSFLLEMRHKRRSKREVNEPRKDSCYPVAHGNSRPVPGKKARRCEKSSFMTCVAVEDTNLLGAKLWRLGR